MKIIKNHIAKHIHFPVIDSTNTWAKLHSNEWAADGLTVITASSQTGGRGRLQRKWESPPDTNLYATFCFWDESVSLSIGQIPQLLALAVVEILEELSFFCKIKWPNDLMLEEKKMGGILTEVITVENKKGIVCGIGININMTAIQLSVINRPATSLFVVSGKIFSIENILQSLQKKFLSYLQTFFVDGFSPFFSSFVSRSYHSKGQKIRFQTGQQCIDGEFQSWESNGAVTIRLPDHTTHIFYAGEFIE